MKMKRAYKDSLFRHIFKDKKRLAHLYSALSGHTVSPKEITMNTLKGVFMNDVKNDISFLIGNRLVILLEHQSSWNPNMPLRFLWYLSRLYAKSVDKDLIYRTSLVKIPAPEFYVLYNGTTEIPYFQKLRLSDAYETASGHLELTAACYNINYAKGNEIIETCYELQAYSAFIDQVRKKQAEGLTLFSAVKAAIRYCESHDLMAGYFKNNESEVFDMVSFKWDEAKAKRITVEETRTSTLTSVALKMLKNKYPVSVVVDMTSLTTEEVERIAKEHGIVG